VEQAARDHQAFGRALDVEDARAGGHPLGVAVGDRPAAAVGVLVLEGPVDDVRDGFEPAVRVPGRALGLAGRVFDLAHLVHVHEGIELGQVDPGERAADGEALALEAARRGGHASNAPRPRPLGNERNAVQLGRVLDGDGGHDPGLLGKGSWTGTVIGERLFRRSADAQRQGVVLDLELEPGLTL
jgi:hypothetical protein